ncbi:hypothetical protein [Actinobacillus arthritidis]|uniref:hypothetical protein n=1 Tax=Actinobacillus arthritidis TaxID=157339 RepID=UPI002441AD0F|nr:hypothetical protein [Actinobacillus arthritidis]WGE89447.1 hypothetical protein NYR89_00175 [Actinobacillus arthritidis]
MQLQPTSVNISPTTFSELPKLIIYKFKANYDKNLADISITKELESLIGNMKSLESMKGFVKGKFNSLRSGQKDDIELHYLDSLFDSYWYINLERHLNYECDEIYDLESKNRDAMTIQINNLSPKSLINVEEKRIELKVTEHCQTVKKYRHFLSNDTAKIDDNFSDIYLGKQRYRFNKVNIDNVKTEKVTRFKISPDKLINDAQAHLLAQDIKADRILKDHLKFEEINLYLIPIHLFSYTQPSKGIYNKIIKFNAVTGEIIRNPMFPNLNLNKDSVAELGSELAVEVANYFVPLSGTIAKIAYQELTKEK